MTHDHLNTPYGGESINLVAPPEQSAELKAKSKNWPSLDLSRRQLCDLELLLNGGFSPLRGFMSRADYEGVCCNLRLKDGKLWPIPIVLDVTEEFGKSIRPGNIVALRDPEGILLAALHVEEAWKPDIGDYASARQFIRSARLRRAGCDIVIHSGRDAFGKYLPNATQ